MKLIYISNTRLPSEKANSYQSMVMCESFANYFDKVEFWYPKRKTKKFNTNPFDFYKINKTFKLKKIFSFDSEFLHDKNQKIWFILQNLSFALNYVIKLRKEDKNDIVFSRDSLGLSVLSLAKKYGIIKQKVFFEAHIYSKKISKLSRNIDGLVVLNHQLKKLYQKDNLQNIIVAHDGVKLDTFKTISINSAKDKLNLDKNKAYITYIGRFNTMGDEKGIPEIIESLQYLDENVVLLCVGGPLDNIEKYYKIADKFNIKKDRMIFIDRQPVYELYKYISVSKILLMPFPWSEHYAYFMSPLKMFEYMASKRVIVASRLPSIEEILEDKKNAILCEPDNPKDLAEKIKWCLDNDTSKIIEQAYKDIQDYTWEKRSKKIYKWMIK